MFCSFTFCFQHLFIYVLILSGALSCVYFLYYIFSYVVLFYNLYLNTYLLKIHFRDFRLCAYINKFYVAVFAG